MASPNFKRLNKADIMKLRTGVDQELAGYVKPEPVVLEDVDYNSIPAKGPLDKDILTGPIVKAICEDMATTHCSLPVAGRSAGIPEKLMMSYLSKGNEDLENGRLTRLAWFAILVNKAEGQVQKKLIMAVRDNPLGWLNSAHLLDHLWPESFAVQRMGQKVQSTSQFEDELKKQLGVAREDSDVGASLPILDLEAFNRAVVIDVEQDSL